MNKNSTYKVSQTAKLNSLKRMVAAMLCYMMSYYGNAQVLETEITIKLQNVPFEKALKEIESTAKVKFVFSSDQLNVTQPVSILANRQTLQETLSNLFEPLNITYKVHEKERTITLKRRNSELKNQSLPDGQSRDISNETSQIISGQIIDLTSQQPLPGVNIIIKGTIIGTTTDAEGKYSINAFTRDILTFSFIGYQPVEIKVGEQAVIDVALKEDVQTLNDVVVNAGYYTTSKSLQTGNISRIESTTIQNQPVGNPLAAMQGRLPGVQIIQQTGVPGGSFVVQVRGRNSLRDEANNPLYIVDGVPFTPTSLGSSSDILPGGTSPLNSINASDIESIEVLKDADATAIYGSRGSNGVILITTKKGQSGKTAVDLNFYSGIGQVSHFMDLLNTQQYLEMRKEAFKNDKRSPTASNGRDILVWDTTHYTDWQKQLIGGTAHVANAQLSISGGNARTQFLLGGGVYKESTVFPGSFADTKASVHINVNHTSEDQKFKLSFTSNYVLDNNNLLRADLTRPALTIAPNAPIPYDENGKINWANSTWANPYAELMKTFKTTTNNIIGNARISYEVLTGLQLKSNLGYTSMNINETDIQPIQSQDPFSLPAGINMTSTGSIKTWIIEPQAEYNKNMKYGKLNVIIGSTFQQNINESLRVLGSGYTSDALIQNLSSAPNKTITGSNYAVYRYAAIFGRLNYNWSNKYIINLTGRRDGSSRFGNSNRFANFGALGAAWIFSEENFSKRILSFLYYGKLRGSYGITGSDQIPDYGYLDTYSSTTYPYDGGGGLVPSRLVNPDYSWETNKKIEAALDLSFIKDRITLNVSWYRNRSSNQLVGYPLPVITGQPSVQFNLPATVQNTGCEFALQTVNIKNQNFEWTTNTNITIPRNKLINYPNLQGSSYANSYVVGKPLTIYKAYEYQQVDPTTGSYVFTDVDKDGVYTSAGDRQTIINLGQNYYGGMLNSFHYKNWQLDIFFQYTNQLGRNYINFFNTPGSLSNQPATVLDRWQNQGDETNIQRFSSTSSSTAATAYSLAKSGENSVEDASYWRLKNISISFNFSNEWISKLHLQSARFYIQGQNMFTITNYSGMDPESRSFGNLPAIRILTGGLQIKL